jgi:hypothetical protein
VFLLGGFLRITFILRIAGRKVLKIKLSPHPPKIVPCRGSLCPPICSSSFVEATGTRKPLAFYWSPLVHILLYDLKHEEIKIAVGW